MTSTRPCDYSSYVANLYSDSGAQPLTNEDDSIILAVNGEIYNYRLIRKNLKQTYNFKTHSDCEVIIPLVRIGDFPPR